MNKEISRVMRIVIGSFINDNGELILDSAENYYFNTQLWDSKPIDTMKLTKDMVNAKTINALLRSASKLGNDKHLYILNLVCGVTLTREQWYVFYPPATNDQRIIDEVLPKVYTLQNDVYGQTRSEV